MNSQYYIDLAERYGAHNYHPLPVVISEAQGVTVKDPEGKIYYDFLSAYSAVNQGHRHPKLIKAITDQLDRCTLTSRAFHNDMLGPFLEKLCQYTGYETALPMNTGAEAIETALKLARRWGVEKKGIADEQQEIIVAENNFHGRTITIVSCSTDPISRNNYGPYTPGFKIVPYDNVAAIEAAITPNTCAVLLEPIQGEAGVYVPSPGYLRAVYELCEANQVLFIADEIQTGLCRTGRRFACDHEGVKPHVMALGKALGGGVIPVSAVVADKVVMDVFTPGSHGSTFGGYPLAMAVGIAALEILEDEQLDKNAERLGHIFREFVTAIPCPKMVEVRGKGLLNAVVFEAGFAAWDVCMSLKDAGLLAKQTHGNIIRFAPPLIITESQLMDGLSIIAKVLKGIV